MPSEQQLKNAEKVVVIEKDVLRRGGKVYIPMVYIDKKGRHERTVTYIKGRKDIKKALECFCTYCSMYAVNSNKLCIYKIRAIKWLVQHGYFKNYVMEYFGLLSNGS